MEWYYVCWPWLTAKRVEPVVSISWASCSKYYRDAPEKFDPPSRPACDSRSLEPTRIDRLFMTFYQWSTVTMGPSRTVSEVNCDFGQISLIFTAPVFNAPAKGVFLGILWRRLDSEIYDDALPDGRSLTVCEFV